MKIAFATPEFTGLVRRTNLADLARALPIALRAAGTDVRVFLPWTKDVETGDLEDLKLIGTIAVKDERGKREFEIHKGMLGELPIHLLSNDPFFADRHPYGDQDGPYLDNWRRYALFARAVLAATEPLRFSPDVFHCVDWTTGLIPLLHRLEYVDRGRDHPSTGAGTFFGIHNLAIQGSFEREILPRVGLPHRVFTGVHGIELGGKVNYLKAGAEFCTILGTHSPGHALRIQEQDRGYGLEHTFRQRSKELVGISNGIDYEAWDPNTDSLLPQTYSADDKTLLGKRKCKAALQTALKLDSGPRTPVAAMIGRFDADSGFDLVAEMLTSILERNIEVVLMGAGRPDIHERLRTMEGTFAGRCRVVEGYDAATAHLVMGGADMLLLPSHYHPSNALGAIAMRYGVVPIVYDKSGLEDYVVGATEDGSKGTGIFFSAYTGDGLVEGIDAARKLYKDAEKWKRVVLRCLEQDFSWDAAAKEYLKAYRRVTRRVRGRTKSA